MFRIKRLYTFILQTFLPLFLMTFFICLFIVLMQFLWKYIDEMVGKGIELPVLLELFFYAAVTFIPMSLPLALLLASLMTFGNLGERFELLAIKAAGVSLIHIMRPLIVIISIIAVGAFFFQNDVLPKAQVKMWTLLYSVRQKSPELEIPEGVFYDGVEGYNLFVKKKNPKTGMLYNVLIYDVSKGYENMMIIASDSGILKPTPDKKYLFLTLYSGESFDNLSSNETPARTDHVPYRRETFSKKEILIPFDANFARMDENVMQNQYIGKDMKELRSSIDSMNTRIDSIGSGFGKNLQNTGYFTLYKSTTKPDDNGTLPDSLKNVASKINIDRIYSNSPLLIKQSMLDRAISRAENVKQDYEYRSLVTQDEKRILRRHQIEMHRKFTLSFACLVFFFIGAPLGAIIRKGGLGMPVVVSVMLFIFYYIIDNTGYKMARDGRWEVWEGIWLSSAVLLPLGIFLTYKAVKDSAVFNRDAYMNFFRRLIGKKEKRDITIKEYVIEEILPEKALNKIEELDRLCNTFLSENGSSRQSYIKFWTKGYDKEMIYEISGHLEHLVEYAQNTRSQEIIKILNTYPVIRHLLLYRAAPTKFAGVIFSLVLPLSIPAYFAGIRQQKQLRKELKHILAADRSLYELIVNNENDKKNEIKKNNSSPVL